MFPELDNGRLQILTVNIFTLLLKAACLNPHKLQLDLEEVEIMLNKCDILCHHVLTFSISLLLIAKFLAGHITLAANIIAMFPILTGALPQLLLPPIFAQAIDNILLNLMEAFLGYSTLYYYAPSSKSKVSVLVIFLTSMTIKIGFSIATLNIYSDFYQYLHQTSDDAYFEDEDVMDKPERFIRSQSLI